MLISDRAVKFQALWNAVSDTPTPPLQLFMRWCLKYDDEMVERAILKTGAKFRLHKGTSDVVHQYAQGLLKNLNQESNALRKERIIMTDNTQTPEEVAAQVEAAYAATPNHFRDLAEQMLRSGEVNESTTIADVKTILEKHNSVRQ